MRRQQLVAVLKRADPESDAVSVDPAYSQNGAFGAVARSVTSMERANSSYEVTDEVVVLETRRSPTVEALVVGRDRLEFRGDLYGVDQVVDYDVKGKSTVRLKVYAKRIRKA